MCDYECVEPAGVRLSRGLEELIKNSDLALEQSGCGGDNGAAHKVGVERPFFLQV